MKKKSLSDLAKEHGWEVSTHKIDTKFRLELLEFLRASTEAQPTQVLAAHFKKSREEIEYYLDMLLHGHLAEYIPVGGGAWGWVAVKLASN